MVKPLEKLTLNDLTKDQLIQFIQDNYITVHPRDIARVLWHATEVSCLKEMEAANADMKKAKSLKAKTAANNRLGRAMLTGAKADAMYDAWFRSKKEEA